MSSQHPAASAPARNQHHITTGHPDPRPDPYQLVTDSILEHLHKGIVPWRCPWARAVGRPRNFHTGHAYQGVNFLLLGLCHFASPYWMTFRQARERGGSVRKGEHGALVVKYGRYEKKAPPASSTTTKTKAEPQPDREEKQPAFYLKGYRVFNAAQIEGIDFPTPEAVRMKPPQERIASAEEIVRQMPQVPAIQEGRSTHACYRRVSDSVEMPAFASFESAEAYHLTLFHELIHATGHESRLARKTLLEHDGFGGSLYSQEELVAEMGAAFLGMEADIVRDHHEQSAAYLKGWLEVLSVKEHRRWIVQAANQAAKAADFILHRLPASLAEAEVDGSNGPQAEHSEAEQGSTEAIVI